MSVVSGVVVCMQEECQVAALQRHEAEQRSRLCHNEHYLASLIWPTPCNLATRMYNE